MNPFFVTTAYGLQPKFKFIQRLTEQFPQFCKTLFNKPEAKKRHLIINNGHLKQLKSNKTILNIPSLTKFKPSITKPSRKHEIEVLRSYQGKENSYLYLKIFYLQTYDLLIPIHIYKMEQKLKGILDFEISAAINNSMEIQDCQNRPYHFNILKF